MSIRTALVGALFILPLAVVTAPAATISVTYSYTVTASGDPINPPLMGNGSGSILPLGTMIWKDVAFPNLF